MEDEKKTKKEGGGSCPHKLNTNFVFFVKLEAICTFFGLIKILVSDNLKSIGIHGEKTFPSLISTKPREGSEGLRTCLKKCGSFYAFPLVIKRCFLLVYIPGRLSIN